MEYMTPNFTKDMDQRCFNDHFGHCGVQFPLFNDLEHLF